MKCPNCNVDNMLYADVSVSSIIVDIDNTRLVPETIKIVADIFSEAEAITIKCYNCNHDVSDHFCIHIDEQGTWQLVAYE